MHWQLLWLIALVVDSAALEFSRVEDCGVVMVLEPLASPECCAGSTLITCLPLP